MKVHRHEEEFDGGMHAWCGRGDTAVLPEQFEATPQALRCAICDRDWFPRGQPDWHYRQAMVTAENKLFRVEVLDEEGNVSHIELFKNDFLAAYSPEFERKLVKHPKVREAYERSCNGDRS